MMDSDQDCVVNAEINMQELESSRTIDFQRSDHGDSGASVIADDLAYIMQSAFIHPIEVINSSSSDQDTSEVSEDDSHDSDDDVRITLVKDKNTVSPKKNEEGCLTNSGDECPSSENETGKSQLISIIKCENRVANQIPRVPNEVLPGELTVDVEEIVLTPNDHLNQLGIISGVVEKMVVVQSNNDSPALDGESAFFFEDRSYLGKVFDTFGPVKVPYYTVHLSGKLDASKLSVGTKVYYVPFNQEITRYVFLEQLRKMKGSDASWRDDCEPPVECLDYSDDEEERYIKKSKSKNKPETSNSNIINKEQRKQASHKQKGNRINNNHSHSNNQNGQGSIWKPGSTGPNTHLGKPILDRSINHKSMNQLTRPPSIPIQPQFGNQKVIVQDSNAIIVHQNSNIPAPTINPILQTLIRLEASHSIRPPLLNDFLPRGLQQNYEMNKNMKLNNGLFPNSFAQRLPSPFGGLQNQQVIMPPQNHSVVRSQLPVSAAPLLTQPGLMNNTKRLSEILPINKMFPQPFVGRSVPVANRPSMTTIQPFGNCPPHQILTSNQNNLRSQGINNFPSGRSNLHANPVPFNSSQGFHDKSHFSMNSPQDPRISTKKPEGIVKLNGFTFKI